MSAQIYVGKNVSIKIQKPVLEEVFGKLADIYDFKTIENGSATHKASDQENSSEPSPADAGWTELANAEYDNIELSDDNRHSFATTTTGNYALMLFRFLCAIAEADVEKIILTFEGYGTAPAGDGVTIKVWNHVSSGWQKAQAGTGSGDEEIVITMPADTLTEYIDDSGFIYLLARTTNTDNGTTNAVLYCDYVKCFVTQAKFTVADTPISDRDMDGVANEVAHVTVKKNGTELTVSTVNDTSGAIELASGDFVDTDNITCSYRYDVDPYVAQELRIEPSREIQGIDGLGSDEIQLWALLRKEFNGMIREVFKNKSQLTRTCPVGAIYDPFNAYDTGTVWTTVAGTPDIFTYDNEQTLRLREDEAEHEETKTKVKWKDVEVKARIYPEDNPYGSSRTLIYLRDYLFELYHWDSGESYVQIHRNDVPGDYTACTLLAKSANGIIPMNQWNIIRMSVHGSRIRFWANGSLALDIHDEAEIEEMETVLAVYARPTYFDWVEIKEVEPDDDYGIVITWDDGSQVRKIGLDKIVFPSGSLPVPKNEPQFVETPFQAKSGVVIS